jgi:hypothetical protein
METTSLPPVARALSLYESRSGLKIKIDRDFYQKVQINSKRFGLLLKGRLNPSFDEIKRLATTLNIDIKDLL